MAGWAGPVAGGDGRDTVSVVWLPDARDDVRNLVDALAETDTAAALRAIRAVQLAARRLRQQPRLGQPLDDDTGRRDVAIAAGPGAYVLRARLHGDTAVILRVRHSRTWHGAAAAAGT